MLISSDVSQPFFPVVHSPPSEGFSPIWNFFHTNQDVGNILLNKTFL